MRVARRRMAKMELGPRFCMGLLRMRNVTDETGTQVLEEYLRQAERCAATGCGPCRREALEYRDELEKRRRQVNAATTAETAPTPEG